MAFPGKSRLRSGKPCRNEVDRFIIKPSENLRDQMQSASGQLDYIIIEHSSESVHALNSSDH
jgi:hypothetical protein